MSKEEVEEYAEYVAEQLKKGKRFPASSVEMFALGHGVPVDKVVKVIKEKAGEEIPEKGRKALEKMELRVILIDLENNPKFAGMTRDTLIKYARLIYEGKPLPGELKTPKYEGMTRGEIENEQARRRGFTGESGRKPSTEYKEWLAREKGFTGESGRKPDTEYRESIAKEMGFRTDYEKRKYSRMSKLAGFMKRLMLLGHSRKEAEQIARKEVIEKYEKKRHKGYIPRKDFEKAIIIAEENVELERKGLLLPAPRNQEKKKKRQYARRLR